MRHLRTVGLLATVAAVLVLVVSMLTGIGGDSNGDLPARRAAELTAVRDQSEERVRVEVLNAAGVPGLARAATETLRDAGFDVVLFGNAPNFDHGSSTVIDRGGAADVAERIAEVLKIERVRSEPDSTLYVEVSVVLGKDWRPAAELLIPPQSNSEAGEESP